MLRRWGVGVAAVFAVAGCSKPAAQTSAQTPSVVAPQPVDRATPGKPSPSSAPPVGPSAPQLAYAYTAAIEAPAAAVPTIAERHAAACRGAGPSLCLVTAAAQQRTSGGQAHAELSIQAEPGWLQRFRASLATDVGADRGKVTASATTTEDLTRNLVDTEAALRAKLLLQGRLEQLLATRTGKLDDLLQVEQALARVQGEIDAARSELAVMRGRVAMSRLTLTYDSRPPLSAPGAWSPLAEALRGAARVFATSLGALVSLVAALTPFALVATGVGIVARIIRRRRRQAARGRETPPAP